MLNPEAMVRVALAALVLAAGFARGEEPTLKLEVNLGRSVQGLDATDRAVFFHRSEGSELIPMSWVRALKSIRTNRPFLEMPERFGLIPDPENRDGLPIGVTSAPSRGVEFLGPMMGINCAACHTGAITYGTAHRVIPGAPNLFDLNIFYNEMFASLLVMAKDEASQLDFMKALEDQGDLDMAALTQQLALSLKALPALSAAQREGAARLFRLRVLAELKTTADGLGPELLADVLSAAKRDELRRTVSQRIAGVIRSDVLGMASLALSEEPIQAPQSLDLPERFVVPESLQAFAVDLMLLRARMEYLKRLKILHDSQRPDPGPGRIDAFGGIRTLVFPEADAIPANAPVSFPTLWLVNQTYWFHWDGNTNSLIERNLGQSLGQGAAFDVASGHSGVNAEDLHTLEMTVRKITAPPWPADLLGALDAGKTRRGEAIYREHCLACHALVPANGREVLDAFEAVQAWQRTPHAERGKMRKPQEILAALKPTERIIPVGPDDETPGHERIGTDPARALNVATNLERVGPRFLGGTDFNGDLGVVARKFAETAYADARIAPEVSATFDWPGELVSWQTTRGYVARPLVGIWATAPYLHNGSVPTLDDLLRPAAQRPQLFPVGHREYDPKKVGYVTKTEAVPVAQRPLMFEINTTMTGNSNAGHEFGTDLPDDDREALLEFLKSL